MSNTMEIDIYSLNSMPLDRIINLYQQGYRISPYEGNSTVNMKIKGMVANCQTSAKTVGQTITISSTATGGTPPYTVNIYKDGTAQSNILQQFTGVQANQTVSHTYTTTSADVGTHTFLSIAYDSCSGNPQASPTEQCSVSISPASGGAGYNCVSPGNCQYVTSNAQYSTQAACQTACPTTGVAGYNCVNGTCQYVTSNAQYSTQAACQSACPTTGLLTCSPPCTATQLCIVGTCVERKYLTYGAVAFGALFLLSVLK